MTVRLALIFVFVSFGATSADAAKTEPIPDATEYRNVRYLPEWRYSGDPAPHRDDQMLLDVAVPDDGHEAHPVLFVVHGGGWSGGSKDQGIHRDIMSYFVERGFVAVNLNYVMRPRGIFPQVFWDYADAARFIRKNARKFKADPARFGAIGLSAGSSVRPGTGAVICSAPTISRASTLRTSGNAAGVVPVVTTKRTSLVPSPVPLQPIPESTEDFRRSVTTSASAQSSAVATARPVISGWARTTSFHPTFRRPWTQTGLTSRGQC